jgi:hypothetical protein
MEGILKQIFLKYDVYKLAISELYLVHSMDCRGTWEAIKHTLLLQLHYKTLLTARVTAAEGAQKHTLLEQ